MDTIEANGIIFIGDPHLTYRQLGRRKDNFPETALNKLSEAIDIANEKNLVPMITGDLLNTAKGNPNWLMYRAMEILSKAWTTPWTINGNHEITETFLTIDASLSLLEVSGLIKVIKESACELKVVTPKRVILVGGTPYGHDIPEAIIWPEEGDDYVWMTHHDIAFPSSYPGALEPFEIKGCDLVVNGHMHKTEAPIQKGGTTWFNPGNITRLSIDVADHKPAVWEYYGKSAPEPIYIQYRPADEVIDKTGYRAKANNEGLTASLDSEFALMLADNDSLERERSGDGVFVQEELERLKESADLSEVVFKVIDSLLERSIQQVESSTN